MDIPGAEPLGQSLQTVQLIIGLGVLVLVVVGMVLYLRWRLPRAGQSPPQPARRGKEDQGERG